MATIERAAGPRRSAINWKPVRTYLGVGFIVLWGLLPFYWMVVVALRDVGYTFDTTPWPTHVTWDNFSTAFDESLGNHFGKALLNSFIISSVTTVVALTIG